MTGEHTINSEISLPARRRRRAVPDWSRHPAPQAPKPISQLLAERDFAARVATVDPTPANRLADRAACDALAKRVIKPPPSSARPTRGVRERASRSKICAASTTTDGVTGACAARTKCSITRGSFAGRKAGPTRAGRRASSPSPTRPGSISPTPSNSPARTNSWFTSPISSRVGTAPACARSSCGKGADPRRRALVGARGRGRSVKVVLNRPFRRA